MVKNSITNYYTIQRITIILTCIVVWNLFILMYVIWIIERSFPFLGHFRCLLNTEALLYQTRITGVAWGKNLLKPIFSCEYCDEIQIGKQIKTLLLPLGVSLLEIQVARLKVKQKHTFDSNLGKHPQVIASNHCRSAKTIQTGRGRHQQTPVIPVDEKSGKMMVGGKLIYRVCEESSSSALDVVSCVFYLPV